MKTTFLFALACAGLSSAHALDLTPINTYRVLEGVKIPVVGFLDGQRMVHWQPPEGWQLSGGDSQLSLYPAKISLAAMQLRLLAHAAAQIPDRTTAQEDLLKWAAAFVPGDTTNLVFDHETPGPFWLGGLYSRGVTFNYVSAARKCSTSVAIVDLNETQSLAVVISARAEDFPAIYETGTRSMFRWDWVPKPQPGQDATVTLPEAARTPAGKTASAR